MWLRRLFTPRKRRTRVFVGPTEIAGYYSRLASGLRQIDLDAVFVSYDEHRFEYGLRGKRLAFPALISWSRKRKEKNLLLRKLKKLVRFFDLPLKILFLLR